MVSAYFFYVFDYLSYEDIKADQLIIQRHGLAEIQEASLRAIWPMLFYLRVVITLCALFVIQNIQTVKFFNIVNPS